MAPEVLDGGTVDGRADVYALGGLLFAALTARAPYERDTIQATLAAHRHHAPPSLDVAGADSDAGRLQPVIDRAMAKRPADRHQSPHVLANHAAFCLCESESRGSYSSALPRGAGSDDGSPRAKRRRVVTALTALTILAAVGLGVRLVGALRGEPPSTTHILELPPGLRPSSSTSIRVPDEPTSIAVSPGTVWVASEDANTVTRISTRLARVIGAPIAVGAAPATLAVVDDEIWVHNKFDDNVLRLNTASGSRVGEVVPSHGIVTDGTQVWSSGNGGFVRLHPPGASAADALTMPPTRFGGGLVSFDGDALWNRYVPLGSGAAGDPSVLTPVGVTPAGRRSKQIILHGTFVTDVESDSGELWVADLSSIVRRFDARSGRRLGPAVPIDAEDLSLSPSFVWATLEEEDAVVRIERRSGMIVGSPIAVGDSPRDIVAEDDDTAWVINGDERTVSRVSAP